jgi:hypothetical protein
MADIDDLVGHDHVVFGIHHCLNVVTIHSVINDSERVTLSLHVYGKHINFTRRSQFDLEEQTEKPFIVKLIHDTAPVSPGAQGRTPWERNRFSLKRSSCSRSVCFAQPSYTRS